MRRLGADAARKLPAVRVEVARKLALQPLRDSRGSGGGSGGVVVGLGIAGGDGSIGTRRLLLLLLLLLDEARQVKDVAARKANQRLLFCADGSVSTAFASKEKQRDI